MEKPYEITYDLNNPGQRYDNLRYRIEHSLSASYWVHYWESTYLVRTSKSASEIMDALKPALDSSDRVYVTEISSVDYSGWLTNSQWDKVKANILNH
ncbi:hypothetical protein EFT87_12400 [Schleiferilactobacillus harbinensis]|uniref:hypothetical protein n=1 Tax=Schleiferilactobacillus harbinensis TaxID=304207 RepID=UPI0021A39BE9|nr:hypothetical protein [Schleiferilactobacillus harbinensis]MCT2909452.1 hypothetical protein [Schleiferilactobacillus harbinensis]